MIQNQHYNRNLQSFEKEPIAIIGIGCRFPGKANSPEQFWKLLRGSVDAITEVPEDRWYLDKFYNANPVEPGKMYSRWGGFIDQIDYFDAKFFGISRSQAERMDPQQRIMLEVAWEALEDAGQIPEQLAGTKTSVFIGVLQRDYSHIQMEMNAGNYLNAYSSIGWVLNMVPNLISYTFDFLGPSMPVDTGCSSSLVAVHLACSSLWSGECELALAGGVNVIIKPEVSIAMSRAFLLSSNGRCKSFDATADGFVRSEGAGIVVLKPLSRALADKDSIYAVIRGSAVNQDGRKHGSSITAPSGLALEAVFREACRQAGTLPHQIQYIEAQGTGTPVADAIEANAIGAIAGANRELGNYCIIGSVKTNIGHLESAAGISGLIKAALALKHRQIPPHLHFRTPNPKIPLADLQLRIPQTLEPWPDNGKEPPLASVNAFGIGGTNVHIVLEGVESELPIFNYQSVNSNSQLQLFPISARSHDALKSFAKAYHSFLNSEDCCSSISLLDICYSASLYREHHNHRLALVVSSKEELAKQLQDFAQGKEDYSRFDNLQPQSELGIKLATIGQAYSKGDPINWHRLYSVYSAVGKFVRLPSYPWQRERYWHESEASRHYRLEIKNSEPIIADDKKINIAQNLTEDTEDTEEIVL